MSRHRKPTQHDKLYQPPNYFNHKYLILRRKASSPSLRTRHKPHRFSMLHRLKHQVKVSFTLGMSSLGLLGLMPPLQGHASVPYKNSKKKIVRGDTSSDLWKQIASDFTLSGYTDNPEVQQQIRWYQKHPKSLTDVTEQAAPYLYYIHEQVKQKGLPGELVLLPIIESAYDPFAYSHMGAAGLWQLMPQTPGLKHNSALDGRRDVINSTQTALNYLNYLDTMFDDNWLLALAAYNSGPGTVLNADKSNRGDHGDTQFWSLHLPKATEQYVPRLLAIAAIIRDPEKYGIHLPDVPNKPYFAKVDMDSTLALSKVAKLSDMSVGDVYSLNPGYSRTQAESSGPNHLLIPVEKVQTFKQNMDAQGKTIDVQMPTLAETTATSSTPTPTNNGATYKVEVGDTLSKIALHNHVKLSDLLAWNHLTAKSVLHNGESLQLNAPEMTTAAPEDTVSASTRVQETFYATDAKPSTSDAIVDKKTYRVKAGDTLSTIAKSQHVSIEALRKSNHLKSSHLKIGQELTIPA